jgi:hypothetical protein
MTDKRKLTQDQVHEIHAHYCGTCGESYEPTLNDWGLTEDDLTIADLQEIDALMFICVACGWWCDVDEMADGGDGELMCDKCADEKERDDDS